MATPNRAKHPNKVKAPTERSEQYRARSSPPLEGLWGQGVKPIAGSRDRVPSGA